MMPVIVIRIGCQETGFGPWGRIPGRDMMKLWLVYALMTAFLWGLWGFFGKLAARSLKTPDLLLAAAIGEFLLVVIYLAPISKEFHFQWTSIDFIYAFLSGLAMMAGILLFYKALAIGNVTPIVLITASYPLVTVFLAFLLLKEPVSLQKIVGAFMAVAGICLISI
jgi:transporter family protein